MIFSSFSFMVFLAALLSLYAVARSYPQRAALILVASLAFYASWKPVYLVLLFASLGINYLLYIALSLNPHRVWLVLGLVLNLTALVAFKYLKLLLETAFQMISLAGYAAPEAIPQWIDWALPLGISFYTFHMLSVLIDVYRGEWTRRISFLSWTMYVTFFPHMIAGPILRASELVEQLERLKPLQLDDLRIGGLIFIGGLAKKVLIADNLSPIVEKLYTHPELLDFSLAWIGTTAFGLQIYFDFSGYSEMAIGLARLFGVTLPRNFLYPYISHNVREFWQRWHITLSRWLRDYLYISLGGSRCTVPRGMANIMITMLLGGLWHGAGWNFLFWGFLHGCYLIGHRMLLTAYEIVGVREGSRASRWIARSGVPTTLVLVAFTWVFFRAASFSDAWTISGAMLGLSDAVPVGGLRMYEQLLIAVAMLVTLAEPWLVGILTQIGPKAWWHIPFPVRGLAYALFAIALLVFGGPTQKFIYFDF